MKLGGCAAISLMITAMRHTRLNLHFLFLPSSKIRFISPHSDPNSPQAALAHLESIIYNPFENASQSQSEEQPKTNGHVNEVA